MTTQQRFVKIFNLRPDEAKPVFYLMAFSFFVGLSLSFYFTASNAIFLKHFQPRMISISYIASGVIVYFAWWILSRLDRKLNISRQLVVKFLFVFITVTAIGTGVWIYDTPWLAFTMFTWVRVLVYITLVTFWGLAGKLFDIRQGKRVFGLISSGEAISIIIGYFSIPLILRFLKAPDLLFLSSGTLLICLLIVFAILITFNEQLTGEKPAPATAKKRDKNAGSYWSLIKKPYFLLISLMAFLPIFGYLFVDFLFLAQTKKEFANNPETIARFLGLFLGFVAVVELIFKMVSGRFLNKYGLKPSLVSLPLILLASIFMAAMFGAVYGAVGLFFAFIALARLFERSVRGAVYEPAFQLLYQPLPTNQRLTFQNQIEGIPKALGTVITGAVIILLSIVPSITFVSYNWVFLIVLALWIWVAYKMYEAYRNILKMKLSELNAGHTGEQDPMLQVISRNLLQADPEQFHQVYAILESAEPILTERAIEQTFHEAPTPIKIAILLKTGEKGITDALKFIIAIDKSKYSEDLQKLIEETKAVLVNAEASSFEQITKLACSPIPAERLTAARLLGSSGRYNTYKLLMNLMLDEDRKVRNSAIISAGKIKRVELWPHIIENLTNPVFSFTAMRSIQQIGEPILPDIEQYFDKIEGNSQAKLRIIRIYESVGGQNSIRLLRKLMNHPDHEIGKQVLLSLSNREYRAVPSEIPNIKDTIEKAVEYIVWIHAAMHDLGKLPQASDLQMALLQELEEKKEHVFLLLSLLYESKTIRHIRENIESKDAKAKVYALEIGDMMISDEIKELFFPVFEDLSVQDRLNRFGNRFPQEQLSPVDRISDIINRNYTRSNRWTKACAIAVLGKITSEEAMSTEKILAANIPHPDRLIGELASWTLFRVNRNNYFDTMVRFDKSNFPLVKEIAETVKNRERNAARLLFETVTLFKSNELFSMLPEGEIIQFLLNHTQLLKETPTSVSRAKPIPDHLTLSYDDGTPLSFPISWLYEFITGSPEFTERFFRYFKTKTTN